MLLWSVNNLGAKSELYTVYESANSVRLETVQSTSLVNRMRATDADALRAKRAPLCPSHSESQSL